MNVLELLTPDQIGTSGENILPHNTDTVRRWLRHRALVEHALKEDGITQLVIRGAAVVRVGVIKELRTSPKWRRTSIAGYGQLLAEKCGADDNLLLAQIKQNVSLEEIKNGIVQDLLDSKVSA